MMAGGKASSRASHAPVSVGSPIMIIVEDEDDVAAFANADPSEFAALNPVALPTKVQPQLPRPFHTSLFLHQRRLRRAVVLSLRKYQSFIPGSESSLRH